MHINKLGRKRNCSFERGSLEIWTASIIYTIGNMNFLFDKSFEPYSLRGIYDFFETKSSTIGAKSRVIRDLLNLALYFDKNFSTSRMSEQNPLFFPHTHHIQYKTVFTPFLRFVPDFYWPHYSFARRS